MVILYPITAGGPSSRVSMRAATYSYRPDVVAFDNLIDLLAFPNNESESPNVYPPSAGPVLERL